MKNKIKDVIKVVGWWRIFFALIIISMLYNTYMNNIYFDVIHTGERELSKAYQKVTCEGEWFSSNVRVAKCDVESILGEEDTVYYAYADMGGAKYIGITRDTYNEAKEAIEKYK